MTDLTGTWALDPGHSDIGFSVRHAGIAKVRGRFTQAESKVEVSEARHGSVKATIHADSFTTGNDDRDAHIKSADFLDVENFPHLTFEGDYDGEELAGNITIHGVTRPITFLVEHSEPVVDPFGNTRVGAEAVASISRKDFGLTWNAPLEAGGVLVGDRVKLDLALSFIKEA